jgi:hypothetical protein
MNTVRSIGASFASLGLNPLRIRDYDTREWPIFPPINTLTRNISTTKCLNSILTTRLESYKLLTRYLKTVFLTLNRLRGNSRLITKPFDADGMVSLTPSLQVATIRDFPRPKIMHFARGLDLKSNMGFQCERHRLCLVLSGLYN